MKKIKSFVIPLLLLLLTTTSCYKDKDEPIGGSEVEGELANVNKFVLENMNLYYLWTDHIPNNLDPNTAKDSKDFFEQMRYKGSGNDTKGDPWSFITDDLQGLLDYFDGVRKSKGYYLYGYGYGDNIALVVAYVYDNSPASDAGLKRGSIIMEIDGIKLTSSNVNGLLEKETYTVTLGEFDFDTKEFHTTKTKKTLTAVELNTNPIIKSEVYSIGGKKIAYLLYNSFIHGYDKALIVEFEKFKAEGVDNLILDFRYNGGGSVATALNISSMIAPKSAIGKTFLKKQYNKDLQKYLMDSPDYGPDFLIDKLSDKAYGYGEDDDVTGMSLPNLDLEKIYVIGQSNTASASELVINGLRPYMNVITVGDKTHGKYVASITIENKTYKNWGIQPIVFKSANANDETDYWDGFKADIEVEDQPIEGDFGIDVQNKYIERMLYMAISDITGRLAKKQDFISIEKQNVKQPNLYNTIDKGMVYDIK